MHIPTPDVRQLNKRAPFTTRFLLASLLLGTVLLFLYRVQPYRLGRPTRRDIELIYYDQLGCGNSDNPKDTSLWDLSRYVEEVEQVRQALHLDKDNFYLLGHSWGGIQLPSLSVPTLTIGGQFDTMDPKHMQWVSTRVQNGSYLYCPNGSHMQGLIKFIKAVDAGKKSVTL
jgi:pimeloyl-ACP methyl ester carboxylesterase